MGNIRPIGLAGLNVAFSMLKGGLGIREFKDVDLAFGMKLWWRPRQKNSLWVEYLLIKYCSNYHPTEVQVNIRDSAVWKRLLGARQAAKKEIKWIMGHGDIDVFRDKWLANDFPFFVEPMQVKNLFCSDGTPNEVVVKDLLGDDVMEELHI